MVASADSLKAKIRFRQSFESRETVDVARTAAVLVNGISRNVGLEPFAQNTFQSEEFSALSAAWRNPFPEWRLDLGEAEGGYSRVVRTSILFPRSSPKWRFHERNIRRQHRQRVP